MSLEDVSDELSKVFRFLAKVAIYAAALAALVKVLFF